MKNIVPACFLNLYYLQDKYLKPLGSGSLFYGSGKSLILIKIRIKN